MSMLTYFLAQGSAGNDVFGTIDPPPGVAEYDQAAGGAGLGLVFFISNLLRIGSILAGLWVLLNFILAGYNLLSSGGDSGAYSKVTQRLTMSVVGIVVIVAAYTIVGIISWVLFHDPGFILNPTIKGPTDI